MVASKDMLPEHFLRLASLEMIVKRRTMVVTNLYRICFYERKMASSF